MMLNERARDISQLWIYAYKNGLNNHNSYYANCFGGKYLPSSIFIQFAV